MPLSWNEIKHRAIKFGNDWKTETREAAERQTFWNEFFDIFGIKRRTVASFEEPVKKLSGNWGAIDIFWPGKLLGEHKSAGQDLGDKPPRQLPRRLESANQGATSLSTGETALTLVAS